MGWIVFILVALIFVDHWREGYFADEVYHALGYFYFIVIFGALWLSLYHMWLFLRWLNNKFEKWRERN